MPTDSEGKFYWLLDRIVRREGIGDVLANGTYWAAKQIGNGAEDYAHNNIKKQEQLPLKLGNAESRLLPHVFHRREDQHHPDRRAVPAGTLSDKEETEDFMKDWIQVPDDKFKEYLRKWEFRGELSNPNYPTVDTSCDIVDWQEMMHYIDDALGMCAGLSSFPLKPPYHIHNYPAFISAATGFDMDEAELTKITRRNRTLVRSVNVRRGMRRADEKPPEDHWKKRFPELEASSWMPITSLKGGTMTAFPPRSLLQNWIWLTLPKISSREGSFKTDVNQ